MSESEYYRWLEKSHYRIKKLDGYRDHIEVLLTQLAANPNKIIAVQRLDNESKKTAF